MRTTKSALLVSAALILTPLGTGITQASAAPSPEPAPPLAATGQVEAMQRDLGLTKSQVEQRLQVEGAAIKAVPAAQRAAGAAFGGVWYDQTKQKLVVALTDQSRASAVRAAGAEVVSAKVTAVALDKQVAAVDKLAGKSVPAAVSAWSADPHSGGVVVDVQAGKRSKAVDAFVAKVSKAGPVTVREVSTPAPMTAAAGTVGGDPYYIGNARCSIGFSAHNYRFVTAGHCGRAGSAVFGWDRSAMGTIRGSSFPTNDYAWVEVQHGWWTVPVVNGHGTGDKLVRGSREAPVGAGVCRSGSTTGWRCGTVQNRNVSVNYGSGNVVHGLTQTSAHADCGDSGGSFLSGDQAQGVTSGMYGSCGSGGPSLFQPVNEILNAYGLRLHTA
ncbi:S1 family peptidase [Kribbella antibiotica]|uniref:S1 family peptidase n=1 Tax=Kribbella antibiotica TaxID=190195 RepID=A0A4R4ZJP2_9ACTN|nr:S1 family peptidase [Kribbella antibiotica]TDD58863.1 S1 family peptidase [Kribbella antibiotica]